MLEVALRHRLGAFALEVDFAAPATGVTALFGVSGSGKSTVINAIAGLMRPDHGAIRLDGTVFVDRARGIDLPAWRRRIGYVFQDARLFPHLRVRDNLLYGWRRLPAGIERPPVDPVVELLGIGHLLDRRPGGLSGGEKQRVALGRALLTSPRLLLMDEPLAALDAARKDDILPYIERLRDEHRLPIVYVSHVIEEVARLADTLVVLAAGKTVAAGPLVEVMSRFDLAPLLGRYEVGAVIMAEVAGHDAGYDLTMLAFPGGALKVPGLDRPVGAAVRLRIRARDVAIGLHPPEGLSIQNVLAARIAAIAPDSGPYAELRLDVGPTPLLARVTRQSVDQLGLVAGRPVHALIKSVAIDRSNFGLASAPEEARHVPEPAILA